MKRTTGAVAIATLVILGATAAPATAHTSHEGLEPSITPAEQGVIDPTTFSGPLVVATDMGDIAVVVEPGEAQAFMDRADGRLESLSHRASRIITRFKNSPSPLAPCGVWLNALASPFGYAESIDGCAVVGYPGYKRQYEWSNQSDVTICAQGRGWDPSVKWTSLGCGGGKTLVPWGNSIAYTKVKAISTSGVTGAAYRWLT